MTIDSSGNVGIGLSSPSYVFDIRTTGNSYATLNAANYDSGGGAGALFQAQSDAGSMFFKQFSTAGGGAGQIRTNGTSLLFQASAASGYMVFETGGSSERMRITSAGNVGIGTTNPGHPLDVNGIVRATSFISTSDGRLKRNIRQVEGLEALTKLNGVRYEWKSNGKSEIGLIAQDVEEIFPEVVVTDEQGFKAVKYQNLIAPIIESTKELYGMCKANTQAIGQTKRELASVQEEIRQLKDENSQLRNQVQDLNKRFEALEKSLNSRKVD